MDHTLKRRLDIVAVLLAGVLGALLGTAYLAWGARVYVPVATAFWVAVVTWLVVTMGDDSQKQNPEADRS